MTPLLMVARVRHKKNKKQELIEHYGLQIAVGTAAPLGTTTMVVYRWALQQWLCTIPYLQQIMFWIVDSRLM